MGSLDAISCRTGCPVCLLVLQMVQDAGITSGNEIGSQLITQTTNVKFNVYVE
jgi:hypothetical protein